jgi:hypothetical protein
MDKLSTALHLDHGLHLTNGVDILSVYVKGDRLSVAALSSGLGGETTLNMAQVTTLFKDDEMGSDIRATAMQAWVACNAGLLPHMLARFSSLARINTQSMNIEVGSITFAFLFAEHFISISLSSQRLFGMRTALQVSSPPRLNTRSRRSSAKKKER